VFCKLGPGNVADYNAKLTRWNPDFDKSDHTFYNQALNTVFNYPTRGLAACFPSFICSVNGHSFEHFEEIESADARTVKKICQLWITDPPYADAINYHELADYFLSWDKKFLEKYFQGWNTDSKKVLAVKGTGESFNQSMIEIYRNLANHMPDLGMQVVMFTHQKHFRMGWSYFDIIESRSSCDNCLEYCY
jgi:adenine-specific DNA methylase